MTGPTSSKASKARARKSAGSPGVSADAIALLEADHREVDDYFTAYDDLSDAAEKKALADQICLALTVHAMIEEEIFYPAVREAVRAPDLLDEATVEHEGAKILIAQIEAMVPGQPLYDAKVTVLGEQVRHHVKEEEGELFPKVRDSKLDLRALGARLSARKAQLLALAAPPA